MRRRWWWWWSSPPALLRFVVVFGLCLPTRCVFTPGSRQQCVTCGSTAQQAIDGCERFAHITADTATNDKFSGRHGHASAVFPYNGELALWVIGGRGLEYEKWNFLYSYERADIWVTGDGVTWTQVVELTGDHTARTDVAFLVEDVQDPGDVAPFWERFGHSLEVLEVPRRDATSPKNNNATVLCMVLCGGFTPRPDNDCWISEDGAAWYIVGRAPWTGRGYHASLVHGGRMLVLGGSPLNNEVWAGNFTKTGENAFAMTWEELGSGTGSYEVSGSGSGDDDDGDDTTTRAWSKADAHRWSPRAGHACTVQFWRDRNGTKRETIFLTGGYAAWPEGHPLYDGRRARNDVWTSADGGAHWTRVVESAPWTSRAWHSLVTWTDLSDPFLDVSTAAANAVPTIDPVLDRAFASRGRDVPRIWLAGGGYVGSKGSNVVRFVDGASDLWWSRDGVTWTEVSLTDAAGKSMCSSAEAYRVDSEELFLGKYGHTMVPFWREVPDQLICLDAPRAATAPTPARATCATYEIASIRVPALYFIAGDWGHYADASLNPSTETYASRATVLCEVDGHKCPITLEHKDEGGDPPSYRAYQSLTSENKRYKLTQGGTCPDPHDPSLTSNIITVSGTQYRLYHTVPDNTLDSINDDYPYTVYSFTKWKASVANRSVASGIHPYAPKIAEYFDGYVARLHGCRCSGERKGEYCEFIVEREAAFANGPRYFALGLLAASVVALLPIFG